MVSLLELLAPGIRFELGLEKGEKLSALVMVLRELQTAVASRNLLEGRDPPNSFNSHLLA